MDRLNDVKKFPKKDSLGSLVQAPDFERTSSSKNLLNGWKKIQIPGDGSCGYHAIMYSLVKNSKQNQLVEVILGINNNKKYKNDALGNKLRYYIIKEITFLKGELEKLNKSNKSNNKAKFNETIEYYDLKELLQKTKISNNNLVLNKNKKKIALTEENYIKLLDQFLKELNPNNSIWIEYHMLKIISIILRINIFIYIKNENGWRLIRGTRDNNEELIDSNNAVFIYYDGLHYETLIPNNDHKLKEKFDNLLLIKDISSGELFNYNFLNNINNINNYNNYNNYNKLGEKENNNNYNKNKKPIPIPTYL